ncbi:amidohydrolase [Holdemania massiliensis]|uniref:amidohydrolase n=1 Tax=Holdemania massiliensis TaxID=1468449 RepID=UPI003561D797
MRTRIRNAKIWLGKDCWATDVLWDPAQILAVGSAAEIEAQCPKADQTIDAGGRLVLPGFCDTHLHLYNKGCQLQDIDLQNGTSIEELIERSRTYLQQHPQLSVIHGRGWNHDYFAEGRLLNRHDLDRISETLPVILTRACGHVACVNTCALKRLGLMADVEQPQEGQIDVDGSGTPTGIFRENAMLLLNPLNPPATVEQIKERLELAMKAAARAGLTTVHSNDVTSENMDLMLSAYQQLRSEGRMPVRVVLQCTLTDRASLNRYLELRKQIPQDDVLIFGPLKLLTDGSLGARTAWMRKPYADDPSTCGIATMTPTQLDELVTLAHTHGLQCVCHAIGDAAIEMMLDEFEKVNQETPDNPLRHGIVHCQITDEALIRRFASTHTAALVQPIFLHYDQHIVAQRVGKDLAQSSYAFRSLAELGAKVSFGTDCPVEDLNPFANLYCALTRKDLLHPEAAGYRPEEAFSLVEALACMTENAAWQSFEEDRRGRIAPGMQPDLTICDQDCFLLAPEQIKDVRSWMTISQGKVQWQTEVFSD